MQDYCVKNYFWGLPIEYQEKILLGTEEYSCGYQGEFLSFLFSEL